jgi:hypothetical protein
MADLEEGYLPFEAVRGRTLGVDVLLPREVAKRCEVSERTVQRWITKQKNRLPAVKATVDQARALGYTDNIGSHGIFFVRAEDLALVPVVRRYPTGTKRRKRKQRVAFGKQPEEE